jgi:hypothetical protein
MERTVRRAREWADPSRTWPRRGPMADGRPPNPSWRIYSMWAGLAFVLEIDWKLRAIILSILRPSFSPGDQERCRTKEWMHRRSVRGDESLDHQIRTRRCVLSDPRWGQVQGQLRQYWAFALQTCNVALRYERGIHTSNHESRARRCPLLSTKSRRITNAGDDAHTVDFIDTDFT